MPASIVGLSTSQLISMFCLIWGGLMLLCYLFLPSKLASMVANQCLRNVILVLATVGLLMRGIPNIVLPVGAGFDVDSYSLVADAVLDGTDVYTNPDTMDRHPYLPLQMYWLAFAKWFAGWADVAFVRIVRLAPIAADICISVLLFLYLRRIVPAEVAIQGGLLYALNPVSVFVSAFHGQFDSVPLLFLLLGLVTHASAPSSSAALLGLGILSKSWPVLALPSMVWRRPGWRRRVIFALVACAVPLVGVLFYVLAFEAHWVPVVQTAISYDWGVGAWGYTYLLRLAGILSPRLGGLLRFGLRYGRYATLGMLALTWLLKANREQLTSSILTVFVAFFAFTHAFSIQYLVWLLPLAVICQDHSWLRRYTLAGTAYMLLVYSTLILASHITNLLPWPQADWFIIMPSGLPVWLVTLGWTVARLTASTSTSPSLHGN